jgi:hypothetical protein
LWGDKKTYTEGEEDQSILHTHTYMHTHRHVYEDSIMKPTKNFGKEGSGEANGNIMREMNLFKVHCIHVWNYHNEIPCIINV